jgi:hypothetical protein
MLKTDDLADELTLAEIADLRDIGFNAYMAHVIRLFRSGRATPAQWEALADALLLPLRTRSAPRSAWKTMAATVLACSESGEGYRVVTIDRAVLQGPRHVPGSVDATQEQTR